MNGFKAYKYYMAVKLHFTTDKYNVFETKGKVKGSLDAFKKRSDRYQFDQLAVKIPEDRQLIQFLVSNFAYGYHHPVWAQEEAQENYSTWIKRKESMVYLFKRDIDAILLHCEKEDLKKNDLFEFIDGDYPELLKLYMGKHITLETMVILNQLQGYLSRWKENNSLALLWDDERRRIEKSHGFVKYDKDRVNIVYNAFLEELEQL